MPSKIARLTLQRQSAYWEQWKKQEGRAALEQQTRLKGVESDRLSAYLWMRAVLNMSSGHRIRFDSAQRWGPNLKSSQAKQSASSEKMPLQSRNNLALMDSIAKLPE